MRLGIRVRLAGLTLSNTSKDIESFGVQRSRKAVHDWVKKADLQHASGASSDQIAVDETMTCIDGQQYWLYAAVNPNSNKFLHIWLFPTTTTALTEQFVRSYARNTTSSMSFYRDHAQHLQTALQRIELRFQTVRHGKLNLLSVSLEK